MSIFQHKFIHLFFHFLHISHSLAPSPFSPPPAAFFAIFITGIPFRQKTPFCRFLLAFSRYVPSEFLQISTYLLFHTTRNFLVCAAIFFTFVSRRPTNLLFSIPQFSLFPSVRLHKIYICNFYAARFSSSRLPFLTLFSQILSSIVFIYAHAYDNLNKKIYEFFMSNRLDFYKMIHFLSFWQITTDFLQQNFLILPPDSDKIRPLYAFSGFSLPDFLRQQKGGRILRPPFLNPAIVCLLFICRCG